MDITKEIITMIENFIYDEDQLKISGDMLLREDLPLTSLEHMMLVYNIENKFNIKIDFSALAGCKTINDLSSIVKNAIGKAR